LPQSIENVSKDLFSYGDCDGMLGVFHFVASFQSVGRLHRDASNDIVFQNLEDFNYDFFVVNVMVFHDESVINAGKGVGKVDINDDSIDGDNNSEGRFGRH
jgi:hypothetical protein